MEINGFELIILLWVHCLADFWMQSREMANNKSSSNYWLCLHILTYSAFLMPFGFVFTVVNAALHFATDYVSSRFTTKFYKAQKWHEFFGVIGIDQSIHITCLILTMPLITYWG